MPFYISYTLISGSGSRFAETAADAVIAYNQLKEINAGGITIKDETGAIHMIEQLLPATAPRTKRDRDPGPSA
jgi:hypothetical protein